MTINKNEKVYKVKENKASWSVSSFMDEARITIVFNVPKSVCPTFEDLKTYVETSELF